ncbi:MAG: putative L-aspartate dehydrogenase [Methanosaeta sp. PtaB.Bin039]|nr:MAG: putative L-aspartate dehydrogenase [Methanosaeta sp. PtaB.Bin039]OPY44581.1 MAG: putative L-aspartate dehydrogenase [Methanosaeta sp. PtaU1.Bin028]HOT06429.1 aspartate dehydrogenase [Methanotrichaceae archaeon]HQF16200.1 aspartate dehydrogenase [Methanotrichaceae archaeon]HQI90936.1 aspartate dehydrogenase [Methanotrichaceae archaeon]
MVLRVGLLGCGAIGREIAKAIDIGRLPAVLAAVSDSDPSRAEALISSLQNRPELVGFDELASRCDLLVEAASQAAVRSAAEAALSQGRDIMIMSVGALMDRALFSDLVALARRGGGRVFLPSGAIAGLDGIRSAREGGLTSVTLTTTKPPAGLEGAPYVLERGLDLRSLHQPTMIYQGPASQAVLAFPANVNVAASLSLASGIDATVRVVADPNARVNTHEILAEGAFGRMAIRIENVPSPSNPKTSYLAALSAIATLRAAAESVRVGT